jgi:hypothetical protein
MILVMIDVGNFKVSKLPTFIGMLLIKSRIICFLRLKLMLSLDIADKITQ